LLDANFAVINRVLREACPLLTELLMSGNKNLKNCPNMQIAKPKK
jgi:hypothetical protein